MASIITDASAAAFPESVEEAAALLGATITKCGGAAGGGAGAVAAARRGTSTAAAATPAAAAAAAADAHPTTAALPHGMHPAFAVSGRQTASELVSRLYVLRALLRTVQSQSQSQSQSGSKTASLLPAAPSILQVLKKLLGVSTQLAGAAAATTMSSSGSHSEAAAPKRDTPPLLSTPCRKLWVDCVVLCYQLQCSTTDTTQFVRQMLALASVHPRSSKAAGGVRMAALQVVAALMECGDDDETTTDDNNIINSRFALASMLAPWSLDVLQVCLKALRSAGNGEPTYRRAAVRAACAAAAACRNAARKQRGAVASHSHNNDNNNSLLLLPGAMEDKAVAEAIRVLRQAAADKFPEVRSAAATLAALLAPLLVPPTHSSSSNSGTASPSDPLQALEEVVQIALRNLDDESPATADGWAEAVARCACTAIYHHQQVKAQTQQQQGSAGDGGGGGRDGGDDAGEGGADGASSRPSPRFAARRQPQAGHHHHHLPHYSGLVHSAFATVPKAIRYCVDQFVRAGGELAAARAGGSFSTGGRAARLGYSLTLTKFLRLQSAVLGAIGESRSISLHQTVVAVLEMVGEEMESKHLKPPASSGSGGAGAGDTMAGTGGGGGGGGGGPSLMFGGVVVGGRTWSKADAGLARLSTSRVLRHGLSELAAEPVQLAILQELVSLLPRGDGGSAQEREAASPRHAGMILNPNQLQVVLIEISHLLATLGEATASKVEETVSRLKQCLSHEDNGVRHEAAVTIAALTSSFPSEGRKLVLVILKEIEEDFANLIASDVGSPDKSGDEAQSGTPLRMFRRGIKEKKSEPSNKIPPMYHAIHGKSLMVSVLVRDLTKLPGGLPRDFLSSVLSVADTLICSQFHEKARPAHAPSICFCVRAGFCLISGVLATGPDGVESHMPLIVDAWQKAAKAAKEGGKILGLHHDLVCVDAILASIVSFLKFCSELLLIVPQALNQISVLLEDIFPLLQASGRFGSAPPSAVINARLESSRASLLEAFAWLPSGSFPMVADDVFHFASSIIQKAIEEQVTCSILFSLVTKEDSILDSKTLCRANRPCQVGGARDLEETIISLTAEIAAHNEREIVIHVRSDKPVRTLGESSPVFRESCILEFFASDLNSDDKAPTPLHEVGTWRKPQDPSCSSKVRIVDAAIQAFSATFGLKDGKEQQHAMKMLESLIPPFLSQLARTIGLNSTSADHERRVKGKDDSSAVANITAVLLSCLQALPLHEATHNVPIGLGPPWMNTAKDLLLTLLPSASTIVRRAAAEGLALLATLGVTEDAHFLQSTLLHSLDEVMQGNKPDGKARPIALEPVSAARSGSLLTLACIQRTAHNVSKRKSERARGRVKGSKTEEAVDKSNENLPVLQMMTRIIPSAACHGFKDFFVVKAYALHSFAVLLMFSARLNAAALADEDRQLLRKAVELVEDNFIASWTAVSADTDRGQETEKMATEVAFLAVLLRFMTFLLPHVDNLKSEDPGIARRFSVMAAVILESHHSHPVISLEAMAFFEVLTAHQEALPELSRRVIYTENPVLSCIPSMLALLGTTRPSTFAHGLWNTSNSMPSGKSLRAVVFVVTALSRLNIPIAQLSEMKAVALLVASLEDVCGAKYFTGGNLLRSAAASREVEHLFAEGTALERELFHSVPTLLALDATIQQNKEATLLRWLLLSRHILSSSPASLQSDDGKIDGYTRNDAIAAALAQAARDVSPVFDAANPVRWQVKTLAAQLGAASLSELLVYERNAGRDVKESPQFDFGRASKLCSEECRLASESNGKLPSSRAIFHLEDLLSSASVSSMATIELTELRALQESSVHFLIRLIECFGPIPDPEDPSSSVLDQFSTQIFSSIKHALSSTSEDSEPSSPLLFVAGCEALQKVVETQMATDPMVLKRLFRPTILESNLLPPFRYSNGFPAEVLRVDDAASHTNTRSSLAARVASIWTAGRFLLPRESDEYAATFEPIGKDLIPEDLGFAIHSAACAVDGCRLLCNSGLSLVGYNSERAGLSVSACGFHFQNEADIDDSVKEIFARSWSSCASRAVKPLLTSLTSESAECRELCVSWIDKLVSLMTAGVNDGITAMRNQDSCGSQIDWASGIDIATTVKDCLEGMSLLAGSGPRDIFSEEIGNDIEHLVNFLFEITWLPALGILTSESDASSEKSSETFDDPSVLSTACNFMRSLAESNADLFHQKSSLLVPLLRPLDLLQKGEIKFDGSNPGEEEVVKACLASLEAMTRRRCLSDDLVKAVLQLVLNDMLSAQACAPEACRAAAKALIIECLAHESVTRKEREKIAHDLAVSGSWEGWAAVATIDGGDLVTKSLDIVQQTICDVTHSDAQVIALATVREVVQQGTIPNLLVGSILFKMGADVIGALYQYGTMKIPDAARSHRTGACADAMKIVLAAYQQVSSEEEEQVVASFLVVVFGTLLAVLRFNGVPNHASPEAHGDPALGRMCAQAILHVARTTPGPFKSCVAMLAEVDRPLLEFAVRAEMTGYAVAGEQHQPVKKKISLAGFRK